MPTIPTPSAMTDRELAEIEFFASVGVFSEDYVTRLVAEVRRLQEEIASVSGIDMLVAPGGARDAAARAASKPAAADSIPPPTDRTTD